MAGCETEFFKGGGVALRRPDGAARRRYLWIKIKIKIKIKIRIKIRSNQKM